MGRKRRILALCLITALLLCSCGDEPFSVAKVIGTKNMKVKPYTATFEINENDLYQVTTYASYVFVAEVVSYDKTKYRNNDEMSPLTYYTSRIVDNIKGELPRFRNIPLIKAGGLKRGTETFLICERDVLPKPGNFYIFAATLLDGELFCEMPNMIVDITEYRYMLPECEAYLRYVESCERVIEDVPNGDQYRHRLDETREVKEEKEEE